MGLLGTGSKVLGVAAGGITGGVLGALADKANIGSKIVDPNYDLIPGVNNPFNDGGSKTTSTGGNKSQAVAAPSAQASAPATGSVYTGSSSGGSSATSAARQQAAANTAAYQDQINALNQLLNAADNSYNQGQASIDQSFNNNLSRLNQSQTNTLQSYATQRGDTNNEYQKNLQRINQNARNGFNNLQLLLGGTGSAGSVLAPAAVSSAANVQRGTSSDAYARNMRDLDTAVTRANQAYDNNKNDLFNQKQAKLQELLGNINSQKQSYLSQRDAAQNQLNIARGGGYTSGISNGEIQSLLNQQGSLNKLFPTTSFNVQEVNADPVSLASYQAEAARQAMGSSAANPGEDTAAASLAALLKQQDDQLGGYAY